MLVIFTMLNSAHTTSVMRSAVQTYPAIKHTRTYIYTNVGFLRVDSTKFQGSRNTSASIKWDNRP
jgi:hypothetical protein